MAHTVTITTTTHSCRKCGREIASHSNTTAYLEPPIRKCEGCGQEVIITTCNEWETLTEFQSAMFWQGVFYTFVYGPPVIAMLGGAAGFGAGMALIHFFPAMEKFSLFDAHPLPSYAMVGAILAVVLLLTWSTYHYITYVRASLARTADPEYKARCVELRKLLIERKEWDKDSEPE